MVEVDVKSSLILNIYIYIESIMDYSKFGECKSKVVEVFLEEEDETVNPGLSHTIYRPG